jgi:ubiquinone/menaquinone biosynthesis C-methylase UbiE
MNSVDLAIKRHDIDASHFQSVYSKSENELTKKEKAFLTGRGLVLKELEHILNTIPKGSKVLDIGCGTAHLTKWIQDKGFEVYGIEPSTEMYDFAVKNFPEINIQKGISSKLPFENNTFDVIVAFEVLRYLDKDENKKTYAEMYRTLKPNGTFFITQVNLYATDFYFVFYSIKELYSKLFNKIHHYCNFTSSGNEISLAKKAGFSEVRTIGVFHGSIRFMYKLSKGFGNAYSNIITKLFPTQRQIIQQVRI